MKACSKCKEVKLFSEFYTNNDRLTSQCRECVKAGSRGRYEAIKPHLTPAEIRSRERARKKALRYAHVKRTYGLSADEYDQLIKQCSICGRRTRLVVDHDHTTGEVRGMLCSKHNLALGGFDDNPDYLYRAIEYLMGEVCTRLVRGNRDRDKS